MSQKVCSSCSAPNDVNASFCGQCGAPLSSGQAPPSYAPPPQPSYQPAPNTYGQQGTYGQPQTGYQAAGYQQQTYGYANPDDVAALHAAQADGLIIPPGFAPAGFWVRFVAFLIDSIITSIAIVLISIVLALISPILSVLVAWFGGFAYLVYFWGSSGATPGKTVMGLTVISTDGQPMTYGKAFLRLVGYMVSGMIFYIGYLMIAFDGAKRGLHDRIAGTLVVKRAG